MINSLLKATDHMINYNNIVLGNKSLFAEQSVCIGPVCQAPLGISSHVTDKHKPTGEI